MERIELRLHLVKLPKETEFPFAGTVGGEMHDMTLEEIGDCLGTVDLD